MPQNQNKNQTSGKSKYLLGFSLISEIGPARFKKISEHFNSIEKAWDSNELELTKLFGRKVAEKIITCKNKINLKKEFELLENENIEIISPNFSFQDFTGINSEYFPRRLQEIHSSPFILFARGDLTLINKNQLAIVGSRRPTHYGRQVLEKLGPEIALSGLIITSGLAMGIDTLAHRIALDNHQPTVSVLGSGLGQKILQKSFNYRLGEEIIEKNGLLISEYPPEFEANKFTFPARNRIISGLSLGVLIIEAAERSGTLITARHALEQNREVLVIPGNIFFLQSVGTNNLIKQGATPITSANDIFKALDWKINQIDSNKKSSQLIFNDNLEELIYAKLSFDPQSLDALVLKCKLDISLISVKLSMLELKGMVKNVTGGYIRN